MHLTDYHAKYLAYELTRRFPPDSVEERTGAQVDAQVDLNPRQIDAALFAFRSPLSKGTVLADEVGLGKTIEAGLVLSQKWAERKRRVLVITPANLRKQWYQELTEKFFLPCRILETKSYNAAVKLCHSRPFEVPDIGICSYQFAKGKASDVAGLPWDLVVIDEAHCLRNVYKPCNAVPSRVQYLRDIEGVVPWTWWPHEEVGHTDESKREIQVLSGKSDAFDTPKPERLINRIVHVASNPGDWVLDSFAGSGTTGAVAHKMGRRRIMGELGEHCHTHIIPRLKKVIDGEDPGGVTEAVGWKGGGGFRYYRLAPPLLERDKWGNWVINKEYNAGMLAEAVCKLEGFQFAPSDAIYWQHGHSTERDFIYVTTAHLGHDQLQQLSDEVGPDRTLLVLCTGFRAKPDRYPNLTIKKIP